MSPLYVLVFVKKVCRILLRIEQIIVMCYYMIPNCQFEHFFSLKISPEKNLPAQPLSKVFPLYPLFPPTHTQFGPFFQELTLYQKQKLTILLKIIAPFQYILRTQTQVSGPPPQGRPSPLPPPSRAPSLHAPGTSP